MTLNLIRGDSVKASARAGKPQLLSICLFLVIHEMSLAAPSPTPDEKRLEAAGIGRTGADLLEFFRKRTVTDQDRRRIADHLQQLGAASFRQREKATRDLLALGKMYPGTVVPLLRRATQDPDLEIARRARFCLSELSSDGDEALVAAAVRVLAGRKPPGTVQVLLAYLPNAGNEALEEDIANVLAAVGVEQGNPDPALVAAAGDPLPLRRLAAAGALARVNGPTHRATAHKLLNDTDPRVRLWTAQALLAVQDKTAVPALIAMLSEGPLATAHSAQGLLWDLAGDQAPQISLGEGQLARRECQRAWQAWWKVHQGEVDLARLNWTERRLGLTLVCECWIHGQTIGAVRAFGPDGKVHWQIEDIRNTSDVQVLPGRRVLLAETEEKKVTERSWDGKLLWKHEVADMPVTCQRLANGNTFIATHSELLEVSRQGKVIYSHRIPLQVYAARKLSDGHILYIQNKCKVVEIDQTGKEVRSVPAGNTVCNGWASFELLTNGHFLITQYNANKVREIDASGKVIWESDVVTPAHATRLANGNTLVASSETNRLVELNRDGKPVSERIITGRPVRVYRR
jgi:hypothetical protein